LCFSDLTPAFVLANLCSTTFESSFLFSVLDSPFSVEGVGVGVVTFGVVALVLAGYELSTAGCGLDEVDECLTF